MSRTTRSPLPPQPEPLGKEAVYERLKEWIIYSELKPGAPLNERELSERFGISRTPLREVLQRLSLQRLIVIRPRKGILVAPIDDTTICSIFEVRIPLERTAVVLACQRSTSADLARLQAIIHDLELARDAGDRRRLIRLDQMYHETIGDLAHNAVLQATLEDLHNVCLRFWHLHTASLADDYGVANELGAVTTAIARGDGPLAARLYCAHILSFLRLLDPLAAERLATLV